MMAPASSGNKLTIRSQPRLPSLHWDSYMKVDPSPRVLDSGVSHYPMVGMRMHACWMGLLGAIGGGLLGYINVMVALASQVMRLQDMHL